MSEILPILQPHLNKSHKDKFHLILTIPNILKSINTRHSRKDEFINLDSLQFSVYSINIPSIAVPETPLHYAGQTHNITTFDRPSYENISVNFNIDNEYKNYWILWKWLQLYNDPIEGTYGKPEIFNSGSYPKLDPHLLNDYSTTITVRSLDEYNKPKIEFIFRNSFINKLDGFLYDYKDIGEIGCSFSFAFNQMDVHLV